MELRPIMSVGNYEKHKAKWLKNYVYIQIGILKGFSPSSFVISSILRSNKKCKTKKEQYCKSVQIDP